MDKDLQRIREDLQRIREDLAKFSNGISVETRTISGNKVYHYDHLGNKFESFEAMCKFHDIPYEIYLHRIERNWSRDQAISTPVKSYARVTCKDHLGNEFPFMFAMCEHWNIRERTYMNRIAAGWTVEQALSTPEDPHKPIVDHIGNEFSSIAKFCDYWKITFIRYYDIVDNNKLFEDYLAPVPCTDHLGNKFPHDKAMCDYWNIRCDLYRKRYYLSGWTLEEALTTPVGQKIYSCKDHRGNRFNSVSEMCKHWNIPCDIYKARRKKGWILPIALTTPPSQREIGYIDHLGKRFATKKAMLEYWDVSEYTYEKRLAEGCDIRTALLGNSSGSSIEMLVDKYLTANKMKFTREHTQHDCVFEDTNYRARYDFFIPSVGIIEVDGEQHFKEVSRFGGHDTLVKNQEHDAIKTAYCEEHGIPLLRIHYKQMQDGTYKDLIEDFISNPATYITSHNKLSEEEYYAERMANLSVASA